MKKGFARRDYQHRKEKKGFAEMAAAERGEPAREQRLDKHLKDEENIQEMRRLSDQFAKCTKKYQRYTKLVNLASKERLWHFYVHS